MHFDERRLGQTKPQLRAQIKRQKQPHLPRDGTGLTCQRLKQDTGH